MQEIDAQLFQSFSDSMPFGVCLVDLPGKVFYWNQAAEGTTGYLRQEVLGREYRDDLLVQCESGSCCAAASQSPVNEVLRDGRRVEADLFLRHKQGHRVPIHVCAFPLRDDAGGLRGVAEIFYPAHGEQTQGGWGHAAREFEMATGLPAVSESREQLRRVLGGHEAATTAIFLVEMTEHETIQGHGGALMLHQAMRTVARTVTALLPPNRWVGCWSDWRLVALVPDCSPEQMQTLGATLAGVGSCCQVKWWGDRVTVQIRATACYASAALSVDGLLEGLEIQLKGSAGQKE